ncbi:MAG: DUF6387 family protein [Stenotrophomonas sp.]|uniref:DUF6387 family protein n=1 Tax=Stenotrophomonas sp. TaxID=69392 RepID=UPI003D6C7890
MARNKAHSRVPSWFNLAAYDRLAGMDAAGWLEVLEALLMLLDSDVEDLVGHASGSTPDLSELEKPFLRFQANPSRGRLNRWKRKYSVNPAAYEFGTTRSLSIGVVARMGATLEHLEGGKKFMRDMRLLVRNEQQEEYSFVGMRRAYERLGASLELSATPFFVALRESSLRGDSGPGLTTNRAISVDMSAPDDIIVEDFRSWLAEMRKLEHHRAARRRFTATDYQKWVRNGYVPLLVLDKWKRLTGARFTYPDFCDAAFPQGLRVEVDDLRKTLFPNARAWASSETIEALAAQAARESNSLSPEK